METFVDELMEADPGDVPVTGAHMTVARMHPMPETPSVGVRREIFGLDEGDVVLTFPENLSADSYDDLEAHLQLFLRKAKRRIATHHKSDETN